MTEAKTNSDAAHSANWLSDFVADGNQQAFARIVHKYQSLVWTICFRILNHHDDAEDAFQLTFALLARKASKIRNRHALASWLQGTAFRTAIQIRRKRRTSETYLDSVDPVSSKDVLDSIASLDEAEKLVQEVLRLKRPARRLLSLYYFAGWNTRQIAAELRLSQAAVESRLRRARRELKQRLLHRGIGGCVLPALWVSTQISIKQSLVAKTIATSMALLSSGKPPWFFHNQIPNCISTGSQSMFIKTLVTASILTLTGLGTIAMHQPIAHTNNSPDIQIPGVSAMPIVVEIQEDQPHQEEGRQSGKRSDRANDSDHGQITDRNTGAARQSQIVDRVTSRPHNLLRHLHDHMYSMFLHFHGQSKTVDRIDR